MSEFILWVSDFILWVSELILWVNSFCEWVHFVSEWFILWVSSFCEWEFILWVHFVSEWVHFVSEWVSSLSEWVSEWGREGGRAPIKFICHWIRQLYISLQHVQCILLLTNSLDSNRATYIWGCAYNQTSWILQILGLLPKHNEEDQ